MRPRLSYANVIATLALFIAIGGTSYAAVQLGKNSVKAKNIAPNAVTSKKVKDGSLLSGDFKAGQLPKGAAGATGPAGPQGLPGETGPQGPAVVRQSTRAEGKKFTNEDDVSVVQIGNSPALPTYSGNYATPITTVGDYFGVLVQAHLRFSGATPAGTTCQLNRFTGGFATRAVAKVVIPTAAGSSAYLSFSDFSFSPGTKYEYDVSCSSDGSVDIAAADIGALGGVIVLKFEK